MPRICLHPVPTDAWHTYATHLLEQGVNILTIKELLGHAHIETTMVYLHLARPSVNMAFSPMDTLYTKGQ